MAGRKEIRQLSDSELRNELRSLGLNPGPISPTTRRIYEKKLSKARGNDAVDSLAYKGYDSDNSCLKLNSTPCTDSTKACISYSTDAVSLEIPAIFYGVYFNINHSSPDGGFPSVPVVFTSKEEALEAVKKCKGARFKAFKTRSEAERFSQSLSVVEENVAASLSSSALADPASHFKGPKPQELIEFRKVIEHGSLEEFREIVFKNPRYLVGSGDTPVILHEGFRYNAIHVAVINNRKDMCQLIIDTLESQNFWGILLKEDSSSALNSQRRYFLVDMYLNTPDKGNFETPLHFACKHGHVEVVEYLVSHPLTDAQRENKYGETPMQIICSRCSVPCWEEKNRIESLLEDNCFVPLLGPLDNSTPSWIVEPWSPEGKDNKNCKEKRQQGSPFDKMKEWSSPGALPVAVRAYAGPMSPSKAEQFYHSWKIPPPKKEQRNSYIHIKRKDDNRGVERIGRQLAHSEKVPWTEYWSFLGGYADFSNSQGIAKLEDYLAKKREQLLFNRLSITPQRVEVPKSTSSIRKTPESRQSSVILHANTFLNERVNTQPNGNSGINLRDVHHGSSRKTLFLNSVESENESKEGRKDTSPLIQVSDVEPVKTLTGSLDKLSVSCQEEGRSKEPLDASLTESPKKQDILNGDFDIEGDRGVINGSGGLPCKKKLFSFSQDVAVPLSVHMESDTPTGINDLIKDNNGTDGDRTLLDVSNEISSSQELKEDVNDDEVFENLLGTEEKSKSQYEKHLSDVGTAEIKVPVNKYLKTQKGQSYVLGSGNQDINIFIRGLQPSKVDLDVLIAVGQTKVDSKKFPNLAKWQKLIMSYSNEKQQSWPSPGSPRYRTTRHKSLMWSC